MKTPIIDIENGSNLLMMESDLETNPHEVKLQIDISINNPNSIITASRWINGGSFVGYNKIKLFANWVFQKSFSYLYSTHLTDMTYAFRLIPTKLANIIEWEELRHPILLETIIKPIRLGVDVIEYPSKWKARIEGEISNSFFRNFLYLRIGILTLLKTPEYFIKKNIYKT